MGDGRTFIDEIARSELKDEDAKRRRTISKPRPDFEKAGCAMVRPVMAVEDYENHPSSVMREEEIETEELRWMNIGSSIFARTLKNVSSLPAITKGGHPRVTYTAALSEACRQGRSSTIASLTTSAISSSGVSYPVPTMYVSS